MDILQVVQGYLCMYILYLHRWRHAVRPQMSVPHKASDPIPYNTPRSSTALTTPCIIPHSLSCGLWTVTSALNDMRRGGDVVVDDDAPGPMLSTIAPLAASCCARREPSVPLCALCPNALHTRAGGFFRRSRSIVGRLCVHPSMSNTPASLPIRTRCPGFPRRRVMAPDKGRSGPSQHDCRRKGKPPRTRGAR